MRFALNADQIGLRDAVRELLAKQCPPAAVRAAWTGADSGDLWRHLAGMGLFSAAVADRGGGLGLDETDLVGVCEELGYAAVALPVAETMAVAAPLLAEAGDPHAQLAGVMDGSTRVAIAVGNGGELVPYARRADLVLALAGARARLVAPAGVEAVSTVDGSLAAARVSLPDGGIVTADPELVDRAIDRADLATAAQLIGLGRRMLDLTTAYVGARRQFGVPVGSFQAVKHHLADALLSLEFAAPTVLAAGWGLATRTPNRRRDVSMAAVLATEAAQAVARAAIQCHGAIGYTVEYDLHLYAKRAWALAATCDVDAHLLRLATSLELEGAP
jgi:alkylation response protein AidB-like acyl-CoA dehydrogenase